MASGNSVGRALVAAQRSYFADHPEADADEWAGLVVVGSNAPISARIDDRSSRGSEFG